MQARFRQNGRCGYVLKPTLSLGKLEKHLKWGSYKKPTGIPKPPKPVAPVAPTVLDSKLPVTVQSGRLGSLDTMSSLILVSAASAPEHAPSLLSVFPDLSLDQPPPLQDFPTVPEGLATPSNTVVLSSGAPGVSSPVVPPAPAALMGDGLGTPLDSSAPQDDDGVDEYSDGDDGDTVTTVTTTATGSVFGSNSVASSSITSGVADHMSIGPEVTFDMPGGGAGKGVRVFWGAEASAGDSSKLAELRACRSLRHFNTNGGVSCVCLNVYVCRGEEASRIHIYGRCVCAGCIGPHSIAAHSDGLA